MTVCVPKELGRNNYEDTSLADDEDDDVDDSPKVENANSMLVKY